VGEKRIIEVMTRIIRVHYFYLKLARDSSKLLKSISNFGVMFMISSEEHNKPPK